MEDAATVANNPDTSAAGSPLAEDLLVGVPAISSYSGEKPRRIYHLHERKAETGFPAFKRGNIIYSRKSWLDRFYSGQRVEVPA
jgi:hypothetical protein